MVSSAYFVIGRYFCVVANSTRFEICSEDFLNFLNLDIDGKIKLLKGNLKNFSVATLQFY